MGRHVIDLSGADFGLWHVEALVRVDYPGGAVFRCRCACGTVRELRGLYLRRGKSSNCGCVRRARFEAARDARARALRVAAGAPIPPTDLHDGRVRGTALVLAVAALIDALPDGLWLDEIARAAGQRPSQVRTTIARLDRLGVRLERIVDDDGEVYVRVLTGGSQPRSAAA